MKKNMKKRLLSLFMVALLVFGLMPNNLFGPKAKKVKAADGTTYTLEASALTAFAASAKADGDTEKAGTDEFFTLIYSAKSKVDGSKKTFADDYYSEQRVNFGGKASVDKNAVMFKTEGAATVKIWWVCGDVNRQMTILDSNGTAVATTAETLAKNDVCISTLELADAGTYYLGGDIGNNYIFKVEVTLAPAAPSEYTLESSALTAFAAGAKADGDTEKAGTDEFFTLIYSAKSKVDGSKKTFADDYYSEQRVNFGGKASVDKNAVMFKTEGAATVKIWWVCGDVNRQMTILDSNGTAVATTAETLAKNDVCISTLELADAGTYYLGGDIGNNYIFKVTVTTGGSAAPAERKAWADVAAPVLGEAAADAENPSVVKIPYTMLIGQDGADSVVITIKNAAGEVVKEITSLTEGEGAVKEFTPSESGTYTTSIVAKRDGEEDKVGIDSSFDFTLPLTKSEIGVLYNKGNGTAGIEYSAVKEAEKYVVDCYDGQTLVVSVDNGEALAGEVTGLTAGKEYQFVVRAVRGTVETWSEYKSLTITEAAQQKWGYIVYGNGANSSNAALTGDLNADGQVTLRSGKVDANGVLTDSGNNGKWVPASYDGINFYYTTVPSSQNFTLRAKVTVNQWLYTNAQEAFGLMANDQLGGSGWNNSYSAVVSKCEYYWGDEVDEDGNVIGQSVTTDTSATKITQKLCIMAQEKAGLTADNLAKVEANDTDTIKNDFSSTIYPLELRYPETESPLGNIIGNCVNKASNENITEMYLTIQKNNTGYFVTYESADGSYSQTKKYYDPEALSKIDSDNVYVGFFTARYAEITFSDVTFTTVDPADDAPAEEKPVEEIVVNEKITSPTATGTEEYVVKYTANCDGIITVYDAEGAAIATDVAVVANVTTDVVTITLAEGKNNFTYVFTPDSAYVPGEDQVMKSYDPIEGKFSVSFRTYGVEGNSLYVAPDKYGSGSKEDPMNIYDAVKYVQPGQTIVVMEGTYKLEKTVKVERGIDGTAEKPIKMVVDPEATSRPVFDFQGICAGMVLAGNYWYFQGFDVTNSADGQKGLQLSGKFCTLDNINAYHNGNTGIQISRYLGTDEWDMWPSDNLVLNCTSYGNADSGYEDADGFAAKLTVADNNVFDGCIAYNNADDGWDLFAKVQSGSIGAVTIKNCVAYGNGYLEDGTNAGNGNGFKMGGDSMSGKHVLENCVAFNNKAKGIDSNSCPDNIVKNCTTFNNESYNVALYTNTAANTAYVANGIISYRNDSLASALTQGENLKGKGTQVEADYKNETDYYWNGSDMSVNTQGVQVLESWFVSTDTKFDATSKVFTETVVTRNEDNTINMNGLLELTEEAPADAGARMSGTASEDNSTVPESVSTYKVIEGANQKLLAGTAKEIRIRIDAEFSLFKDVEVDDVVVDPSKYTAVSGSTVITFKDSYIKSLKAGEHTVRVNFTDGKFAETKIFVEPNTGDSTNIWLYVILAIVALGAAGCAIVLGKKKMNK